MFMKILDILQLINEAETQKIYAYHASSANNLKSIVTNGLIPNKEKGGYGDGEKSTGGYELKAMAGTYFYKDSYKALQLGKTMAGKNGNDSVVVVAKIQPKTAEMDEDRLNDDEILNDKLVIKLARDGVGANELYSEAMSLLVQNLQAKGLNTKTIKAAIPTAQEYVKSLIAFATNGSPEQENAMRYSKNELTKRLKKLVVSDGNQVSFKINEPITYSGANKIIGLLMIGSGVAWGDVGELERNVSSRVRTPAELIRQR